MSGAGWLNFLTKTSASGVRDRLWKSQLIFPGEKADTTPGGRHTFFGLCGLNKWERRGIQLTFKRFLFYLRIKGIHKHGTWFFSFLKKPNTCGSRTSNTGFSKIVFYLAEISQQKIDEILAKIQRKKLYKKSNMEQGHVRFWFSPPQKKFQNISGLCTFKQPCWFTRETRE